MLRMSQTYSPESLRLRMESLASERGCAVRYSLHGYTLEEVSATLHISPIPNEDFPMLYSSVYVRMMRDSPRSRSLLERLQESL